jgi:hypothetical protein
MSSPTKADEDTLADTLAQIDELSVCTHVYVGEPEGFTCLNYFASVARDYADFSPSWTDEVLAGDRLCPLCAIKRVVRAATESPAGCACRSYFARQGSHAQGCPLRPSEQ